MRLAAIDNELLIAHVPCTMYHVPSYYIIMYAQINYDLYNTSVIVYDIY